MILLQVEIAPPLGRGLDLGLTQIQAQENRLLEAGSLPFPHESNELLDHRIEEENTLVPRPGTECRDPV